MAFRIDTAYRPSLHGFHFGNEFVENYGEIRFWGRCNGMSWTSLDYFFAGRQAPPIVEVDFANRALSGPGAGALGGVVQLFKAVDGPFGPRISGCTLGASTFSRWHYCINGIVRQAPAAVVWPSGTTFLLVIGQDHQGYVAHTEGPMASLSEDAPGAPFFEPIGGKTDETPAIAAIDENQLDVYVLNAPDHKVHWKAWDRDHWREWEVLGAPNGVTLNSNPAAVSWPGFRAVIIRGSDGHYWERCWRGDRWDAWKCLDGTFTSGPAACQVWPGRYHVFGRGQDGAIWMRTFDRQWDDWTRLAPPPQAPTTEAPAAVGGNGFVDVFARIDQHMWRLPWRDGGWQSWEAVHREVTPESRRLTDAVMERNMAATVRPLIAATALLGAGLPFIGCLRNYVTWRSPSDEDCFRWSSTDELSKLIQVLSLGTPTPLGLIAYGGWGHEVVAYGLESANNLPALPPGAMLPGPEPWRINIYDPRHPDRDDVVITIDTHPAGEHEPGRPLRIYSSTGEHWRGCFVRDDYRPISPPL